MRELLIPTITTTVFTCCVAIANAGALEAADDAYARGDFIAARKLWEPLAERGAVDAQLGLANLFERGLGVRKDPGAAVKWYRKAAQQGSGNAFYVLGDLFASGDMLERDLVSAHMWFSLAAQQLGGEDAAAAVSERDKLTDQMSPAEIALAKGWASQCRRSNYKRCGDPASIRIRDSGTHHTAERPTASKRYSVPMKLQGGTYVVPVLINNAIRLEFVVDSGASDVSIPADVVTTLIRSGTITSADFIGKRSYRLADGSMVPSMTFRIRSLQVGNRTINDVVGSVAPIQGELLLGQSFLGRFKSWSVDNGAHALVLE